MSDLKLFEEWAEGLVRVAPDAHPRSDMLQVPTTLTRAMQATLTEHHRAHIARIAANAMARGLVKDGSIVVAAHDDERRDSDRTTSYLTVDTAPDTSLLAYTLHMENCASLAQVSWARPWYRVAWDRIRRRPLYHDPLPT